MENNGRAVIPASDVKTSGVFACLMKILITNYTGHQPHLGCMATCDALEQLLHVRYSPDEIIKEKHSIKRADELMYLGAWGRHRRAALMRHDERWENFRNADLIAVNAEGTLHSKTWLKWGAGSNQRLIEAFLAARYLKKPVMMVNHSVSSRHKPFDQIVCAAYADMKYVAVREPLSLEYLQGLGLHNAQLSADAIFAMTPPAPAPDGPLAGKVLISDSFSWKVGWQQRRGRVREVIEGIRAQGFDVAYLSVLSQPYDRHFAESLDLEYHAFETYHDFMAHLQTAAFVLTGRFHIAVFAALCATPFLSFEAPTYKLSGLCRLLDHPLPQIDLFWDEREKVAESVRSGLDKREAVRAHLLERRKAMHDFACRNVPDLDASLITAELFNGVPASAVSHEGNRNGTLAAPVGRGHTALNRAESN